MIFLSDFFIMLFPSGEFIPPLQLTLYRFLVYASFIFHGIALCIVFAGRNDESFLLSPSDIKHNQVQSRGVKGRLMTHGQTYSR